MKNVEKQMADMFRNMDATHPLQHYEEYRDSLLPTQEIDYKDVSDAFEKIINPNITAEEHLAVNAVLKKALLQPVMADTYAKNGIKSQDVAEYVDMVDEYYPREKEALLRGLSNAYKEGAKAMNEDDSMNHRREWYALNSSLGRDKDIAASMTKFIESKTQVNEEPAKKFSFGHKVLRWVKEKMPGAKTVAAGFVFGVAVTQGLKQMIKVWDKQADKSEVVAKNDKQNNGQEGKTYTPSAKDFSNQGRA